MLINVQPFLYVQPIWQVARLVVLLTASANGPPNYRASSLPLRLSALEQALALTALRYAAFTTRGRDVRLARWRQKRQVLFAASGSAVRQLTNGDDGHESRRCSFVYF
eukprot:5316710-Pleurochrysis_carterae.AAC.3